MKIIITELERDCVTIQEMSIDGKNRLYVGGGEPEDQIIGRDLVACQTIAGLMEEAYEAGKRGEPFDVETVKGNDDE